MTLAVDEPRVVRDVPARSAEGATLTLALRFALREMRRGLSGFVIFVACIALGVAAIVGVNAVALSISDGVQSEGRAILGGDVSLRLLHRDFSPEQKAVFAGLGQVDEVQTMRAMVRSEGATPLLAEVKGVAETYPLVGRLVTDPPTAAVADGAVVDAILLDRLGVGIGDPIRVGSADVPIVATLVSEPDRASDGLLFGPRVLVSRETLQRSGLVQPGSLVNYEARVALSDDASLQDTIDRLENDFEDAGWRVRSRLNAAPGLTRSVERFSQFLTLVGLTALIVGGVGVANATRAYLDGKQRVIASMKGLGAPADFVFATYLIQMLLIASVGIAIGLVLGSLMPLLAGWALEGVLPVAQGSAFQPGALLIGLLYGYLTALAFALWPLGQARNVPATALLRSVGRENAGWPAKRFVAATLVVLAALAALAIFQAADKRVALTFVGGILFAFVLLRLVSWGIQWLARRARHAGSTPLRLAIGNIHRPGALTPSVVLSLGLGLALLVALAMIDGNLRRQISDNIPDDAPDFFFIDVQNSEIEDFQRFVADTYEGGVLQTTPMLRGRVTALDGVPAAEANVAESGRWVLRGDRGVTYSASSPENASVTQGEWWPSDYSGEPLVSFAAEEAGELGLSVGDTLTVNVLGREITARVANLREVEWQSFGMNFLMVFSPNTFAGAPHAWLATLALPGEIGLADRETRAVSTRDANVLTAVSDRFPTITAVRVRDALTAVNGLVNQLATAIRAAAAIALVASILVLAGALAAGNRARTHDAVVLKTLGATRRTLIGAYVLEYSLLGFATAVFALAAGSVAAWFVVAIVMGFSFTVLPTVAIATVLAALVFTVGFGLVGTWRVLGQKAAPHLREI